MLAKMRNGTLYGAGWLGGEFYLITRKKEKTDADFQWTGLASQKLILYLISEIGLADKEKGILGLTKWLVYANLYANRK